MNLGSPVNERDMTGMQLLRRVKQDFEDGEETEVPYASLMELAARGYLHCERFVVSDAGHATLKSGADLQPHQFRCAECAHPFSSAVPRRWCRDCRNGQPQDAQAILAEALGKVAEHLRSGIVVDADPQTGQQSHRSQWDYDAEHLVSYAQEVLATFGSR